MLSDVQPAVQKLSRLIFSRIRALFSAKRDAVLLRIVFSFLSISLTHGGYPMHQSLRSIDGVAKIKLGGSTTAQNLTAGLAPKFTIPIHHLLPRTLLSKPSNII